MPLPSLLLVSLLLNLTHLESIGLALAQASAFDQMSEEQIKAAVAAKPNSGFVLIEDLGFSTPTKCQAQMPSEAIFSPAGWVNARSQSAKTQYLPYKPSPDDTVNAITVISKGCASGTPAGPVCESITRVVLLSDASGSSIAEAKLSYPMNSTWQNGYGAQTACSSLVSKFSVEDLAKVRGSKGEFLIATFSGATPLKRYTVKQKHLKSLGL